ncbi:TetR/AcrR family transcriptional regulator [Panacagrimonas sp.]|uniref:TetR/AcrR family transcriptional regulator n=1 Tax=Panacagrimonas sp. TaxID=2480088 RepID=UPI003B52A091
MPSAPKTPLKPAKTVSRPSRVNKAADAGEDREPRQARRKRETRDRLVDAAFRLMAERGMAGVAINEITEAADVGFGSFYNHFESKEAIYDALIDRVFNDFGDALDRLVKDVADPAEMIAYCIRHALLRARREPLWGQFLLRESYSSLAMTKGLGQRLLRDIGRGVAAKRFHAPDVFMSFIAAGGIVLAAVAAEQMAGSETSPQAALIKGMGMTVGNIPERTAALVLTTLGVSAKEAAAIARKPLPVTEPPQAGA